MSIQIFFRNCTYGEQSSNTDCTLCKEETFLIEPATVCKPCPSGGICPGGLEVLPRPGYWRSSNLSEIVYAYPVNHACIGDATAYDTLGSCSEGYYGIMCSSCKGGFQKLNDNSCGICPSPTANVFISLSIVAVVLAVCIVLVKTSINTAFSPKAVHSIYIKIITNYLQFVFLTAQFEFNWPTYAWQFLNLQSQVIYSTTSIFSFDCFTTSETYGNSMNIYYYKLISMSVLPILVFTLSFLIWLGICFTKETYSYLKRELFLTMIIIFFLVYPNISMTFFSHFSCQDIDKLGSFVKTNYAIECWTWTYTQYYLIVVIPGITIWVFALPIAILVIMTKRRNQLHTDNNRVIFGFFFNGYKNHSFFWEFFIIYRKIIIISIVVFFSYINKTVQALSIFLVTNCTVFIHHRLRPYISKEMNNMEMQSLIVSAVTIYSGLFYLTNGINTSFQFALFILMLTSNTYLIAYWCYYMIQALLDIIVKFSPRLRYFLKKGDDYNIEFFQEPISRNGSYFEKREGIRLNTFMKKIKPKHAIDLKIKDSNALFLKVLEEESKYQRNLESQKKLFQKEKKI